MNTKFINDISNPFKQDNEVKVSLTKKIEITDKITTDLYIDIIKGNIYYLWKLIANEKSNDLDDEYTNYQANRFLQIFYGRMHHFSIYELDKFNITLTFIGDPVKSVQLRLSSTTKNNPEVLVDYNCIPYRNNKIEIKRTTRTQDELIKGDI